MKRRNAIHIVDKQIDDLVVSFAFRSLLLPYFDWFFDASAYQVLLVKEFT
jgi:hypothetical protein